MRDRFLTATMIAGAVTLCCAGAPMHGDASVPPDAQAEFRAFLAGFEAKLVPLSRDTALAGFQASVSGKDEDYTRSADLQIELNKLNADPANSPGSRVADGRGSASRCSSASWTSSTTATWTTRSPRPRWTTWSSCRRRSSRSSTPSAPRSTARR